VSPDWSLLSGGVYSLERMKVIVTGPERIDATGKKLLVT
jgi:hypothetical protein